ncbi:MAG: hypothetical protein ACP5D7_15970 [Limnospira sp.]
MSARRQMWSTPFLALECDRTAASIPGQRPGKGPIADRTQKLESSSSNSS